MKYFLRFFSVLMHPLFMPLLGVGIYFSVTPKFVPQSFMYAKLFAVSILTIVVPVLFYFLLESVKLVSSVHLREVKERRIPLLVQVGLILLIIRIIINGYEFPELYIFFLGILITAATSFILSLLNFKTSLHMVGVSGVLCFVIALSMIYNANYLVIIGLLILGLGFTAASRLELKAHTMTELLVGLFIGGIPQFLMFYFYKM